MCFIIIRFYHALPLHAKCQHIYIFVFYIDYSKLYISPYPFYHYIVVCVTSLGNLRVEGDLFVCEVLGIQSHFCTDRRVGGRLDVTFVCVCVHHHSHGVAFHSHT